MLAIGPSHGVRLLKAHSGSSIGARFISTDKSLVDSESGLRLERDLKLKKNQCQRQWYARTNNEARKRWHAQRERNRQKKNPERFAREQRERRQFNPELYRKWGRDASDKLRSRLFDLLGAKCVRCGFEDKRALQLDHINGGGTKDVKKHGDAHAMYRWYVGNPELALKTVQVLCANCNWIKRAENHENPKGKGH